MHHIIGFDIQKRYEKIAEACNISKHFDSYKLWYNEIVDDLKAIYEKEGCTEVHVPKYPSLKGKSVVRPMIKQRTTQANKVQKETGIRKLIKKRKGNN